MGPRGQEVQYRHAYGHPIFYLLQYNGATRVGYIRGQLYTTVNGTRVHDDNFLLDFIE